MRDPLNRTTAPLIMRFFDTCFKQGVIDARALGDDYGVREFIAKHKEYGTFGVLGDEKDYDWQAFRFTLYWWARKARLTGLAENYILFVRKKNYLWCLLPFCMRFYMLGMEEWLEYPSPAPIELFKGHPKTHWNPDSAVKHFTRADYVSYLHSFAFDYGHMPVEYQIVPSTLLDSFCQALYDLTSRYVAKRQGYI